MKHHRCLLLLLLSLFDHPLILNTKDSNTKDSNNEYYPISFKNEDKGKSLPSICYDNYIFVIVDGKVQKVKTDELNLDSLKTNTNDNKYEYLNFSELPDKLKCEYQLEKGSILWKINIEKSKRKSKGIFEESDENLNFVTDIIKIKKEEDDRIAKIKNLVKDFIIKNKKITIEEIEIEELAEDFVVRIVKIEDLEEDNSKWKKKIFELVNEFTKRMDKIEELAKDLN